MNWWSDIQADCVVSVSEFLSLKSDQRRELLKASVLEVEILLWQGKARQDCNNLDLDMKSEWLESVQISDPLSDNK